MSTESLTVIVIVIALQIVIITQNAFTASDIITNQSSMVKTLNKYRAVESRGRCYKLELPEDFGDKG